MFSIRSKSRKVDDPVKDAIIAAKEEAERQSRGGPRAVVQPAAGLPCLSEIGLASCKRKAKELQAQQQQRREAKRVNITIELYPHSSQASSRQGSFDTDPLDMSPLNSPLSAPPVAAHRDDSDLVDDEDATDWNDFSLSSPPSPKNLDRKRPNKVYGEEI